MFDTLKSLKNTAHIIILTLTIIFIFFTKNLKNMSHASSQSLSNHHNSCIHHSNEIIMHIYNNNNNTTKNFRFTLIAQHIQYHPNEKTTRFFQPNIIIFDTQNIAIWTITSNQALLNKETNILYLQGYIYINNLSKNTYFSSMITNQLKINLTTNDFFSQTTVILHGHYFYSIGAKMHGNLYTQKIQLLDNTHTYYETQYIKQ